MTPNQQRFCLEDLIGGQAFTSGSFAVTAEAIKRFASEFDPQPFHVDESTAAISFFDGLVASGWHTAAMTMQLLSGERAAGRWNHRRQYGQSFVGHDLCVLKIPCTSGARLSNFVLQSLTLAEASLSSEP